MTRTATSFGAPPFRIGRNKTPFWTICFTLPGVVLLAVGVYFANTHWPYRYRNVQPFLDQVFASKISIGNYHRTYFPNPGFVAKDITLRRNSAPDLPPVGSAQNLVVQGTWVDLLLFRRRVHLVDVEGLHVVIPSVGSRENKEDFPPGSSVDFAGPSTTVEELYIHGAALDIMRANGSRYTFPIWQLIIRNLQRGQAVSYFVDMQNGRPTGRIQASGNFGPLTPKNLGVTPVSGKFTFTAVNLQEIGELHGTLSSEGHFSGALSAIEAYVTAATAGFAVNKGRPVSVNGSAQCTINGLNANIVLHKVVVKTGATTVEAGGNIAGSPKVTDIELNVVEGRAEDLLHPFMENRVPITGIVSLKAHAHLAPSNDEAEFFQRLSVDGGFDVPDERMTNRKTEKTLTGFSQRAQGLKRSKSDPGSNDTSTDSTADVLSSLDGRVKIRDGVVETQRLTFGVPGAVADLNGWYDLRKDTVHLLGNLRMDSDISHVTTGFKSLLLKPLVPFFKKDNAGAVIPIAVTGGPNNYKVTQNLLHRK